MCTYLSVGMLNMCTAVTGPPECFCCIKEFSLVWLVSLSCKIKIKMIREKKTHMSLLEKVTILTVPNQFSLWFAETPLIKRVLFSYYNYTCTQKRLSLMSKLRPKSTDISFPVVF